MRLSLLAFSVLTLLITAGCAPPSYQERWWEKGELVHEIVKWDNSTFTLGKAIGIEIGYSPEAYSPKVKLLYGRYESARVRSDQTYSSKFGLKDVNLFKGEGSSDHDIEIAPAITATPEEVP